MTALAVYLLAATPAWGQPSPPIEATWSVPSGELTVGDPIALSLIVTHPAGYQVIPPQITDAWSDLRILGRSPATVDVSGDGTATTTTVFDARLFAPGIFSTPALPVMVTDGAGRLLETVAAPATVTIASVLAEGDGELRDIKPQAVLPQPFRWPWLLAALLFLLAAPAFVVLRQRRRQAAVPAENREPHEVASSALDHIEALRLPQQGHFKEHYGLVSGVVRVYMERVFALPALERTTAEIGDDMTAAGIDPAIAGLFVAFLAESDLIKFSTFTPSEARALRLLDQARSLVAATRPDQPGTEAAGSADVGANARFSLPVRGGEVVA